MSTAVASETGKPGRNRAAIAAVLIPALLGIQPIAALGATQVAPQVSAPATAPEATPDSFVTLFSITCMKYYNAQEQLRAAMKKSGSEELSGDAARFFLSGKPGNAWTVPIENQRYVVTLRSDGICTAFAQKAEIETVQKDFTRLVSRATPPAEARLLAGGPGGAAVHTITYAWSRPADTEQLVFTLTTSTNPTAPVQAMATMALTAK